MPPSFNASRVNLRRRVPSVQGRENSWNLLRNVSTSAHEILEPLSRLAFTFVACESLARKSKSHWLTAFCDTVV
jgi:hypothetical protein